MLNRVWALLRATVEGYIEDEAMGRGAAIAYYTIFSIAPLLVIATATAGFFFGEAAVQGALAEELRGLLGVTGAEAVEAMVRGANNRTSGTIATLIGVATLLLTASGVFGELQSALNAIWRVQPAEGDTVTRLMRAKLASLGLVAATGFLLLVSLVASAVLSAIATWFDSVLPGTLLLLGLANFLLSFLMVAVLFGAIYKILPARPVAWRDVTVGALVTAMLFTIGKSLIGWYVGSSSFGTGYGAAGALMIVLLWVYYSAQVFLLGAEFTRAWGGFHGTEAAVAALSEPAQPRQHLRQQQKKTEAGHFLGGAAAMALVMAVFRRRR
ncbi:YihY/virulence factor BrkB family protein [Paeniroseomonas aquatica]|uniref:YihY/virulence factor BrkB family protein n=1 Tax=Paeniroseomonas aquatica TaxID=373043 RepID=A0ABT8A9Z4_9PROT|nr:YihY/virulence factor BrkB family protein [Paeniroseomonas aquatica]MDN3566592.1 YihY/virulence factor BrkB family protein [Paeniroseomonas aquatica]